MKRLFLSLSLISMVWLASCEAPSDNASSMMRPDPSSNGHGGGGTTADAHPAWTFGGSTYTYANGHGGQPIWHETIAVSDSDGTDVATVYQASGSNADEQVRYPTWSPTGSSISFVDGPPLLSTGFSYGACSIKAIDVSVSNGAAIGSNGRAICSYTTSDSTILIAQRWSPTSTVNKIAFIAMTPTEYGIYTVSASGGTASRIYSGARGQRGFIPGPLFGNALGWSNDGSKIAFVEEDKIDDSTFAFEIKIINSDGTGTPVTLDSGSDHRLGGVQWSHSGSNNQDVLCYYRTAVANPSPYDWDVYRINPDGSNKSAIVAHGLCAFWSPDNSELVYSDYTNSVREMKKVNVATGVATATSITATNYGDWKP